MSDTPGAVGQHIREYVGYEADGAFGDPQLAAWADAHDADDARLQGQRNLLYSALETALNDYGHEWDDETRQKVERAIANCAAIDALEVRSEP